MTFSPAYAQNESLDKSEKIQVIIQDLQGKRLEGYLSMNPPEVTVASKEKEEKSFPLKAIESITFEPVRSGLPGADELSKEGYYSVRLRNSQEIFTLKKKYSLNLNTEFGMLVREIDPNTVQGAFQKDPSPAGGPKNGESFVRDKSMILSIEFKF
jgi:hypothetical protein